VSELSGTVRYSTRVELFVWCWCCDAFILFEERKTHRDLRAITVVRSAGARVLEVSRLYLLVNNASY